MPDLVPVIAGLIAGIGLIVTFTIQFSDGVSLSPTDDRSNMARIAALYNADCINAECAAEIILHCEDRRNAVVPRDGGRVWAILPEERHQFCHIFLIDFSLEDGIDNPIVHDCGINYVELASLQGRSFREIIGGDWPDPLWTCHSYQS